MGLETLLVMSCIYSYNHNACLKMGEAYYKYEKIDDYYKKYYDKYGKIVTDTVGPEGIIISSTLVTIKQRKASIILGHGVDFTVKSSVDGKSQSFLLHFQTGF